jgi:hypothetical protein
MAGTFVDGDPRLTCLALSMAGRQSAQSGRSPLNTIDRGIHCDIVAKRSSILDIYASAAIENVEASCYLFLVFESFTHTFLFAKHG